MEPLDRLAIYYAQATKEELTAARCFYFECHRFILWLSAISGLPPESVSAITAALSPRATWEGNQHDAVSIALGSDASSILGAGDKSRFMDGGGGGYQAMPRDIGRAIRMANGEPVENILKGPKVNAFHRNMMTPRKDTGLPIDRHLFRALYGRKLSDAQVTSKLGKNGAYEEAELLYSKAAGLRGVRPIVYGNAIWYVMRRLSRDNGQFSLKSRTLNWRPLYGVGTYQPSTKWLPRLDLLPGCVDRPWLFEEPTGPRFGHETANARGRIMVTLGPGHRYANTGGWQYRYRLVVSYALERKLVGGHVTANTYAEHVDHINGIVDDDRIQNLQLIGASIHGQTHALATVDAGGRSSDGHFVELAPDQEFPVQRFGPVVSMREIDGWIPAEYTLESLEGPWDAKTPGST